MSVPPLSHYFREQDSYNTQMATLVRPSFRPLPFLSNPHVQTVVAHLTGWGRDRFSTTSSLVTLDDGDTIGLHESANEHATASDCVLLVHGLGGSHRSPYMRRVTRRLVDAGLRVFRMDLRGAGLAAGRGDKLYNAGCSGDVRAAAEFIANAHPKQRLHLVGFSLGGNIVLKLAGEAARSPVAGLASVAAVAPPIDLVRCSELIRRLPFYDRFYVRHLTQQVAAHVLSRPHLLAPKWPRGLTLQQFDDLYTAPLAGFADAHEYYVRSSSRPLIPQIEVPAFLLTASDDPFVASEPFESLPSHPRQWVHIIPRGGHLGFLGPDGRGGVRWAETQIVDWIVEQNSCSGPTTSGQ